MSLNRQQIDAALLKQSQKAAELRALRQALDIVERGEAPDPIPAEVCEALYRLDSILDCACVPGFAPPATD